MDVIEAEVDYKPLVFTTTKLVFFAQLFQRLLTDRPLPSLLFHMTSLYL